MTIENFDHRERSELFEPARDADDLQLVMPTLRKLLAVFAS